MRLVSDIKSSNLDTKVWWEVESALGRSFIGKANEYYSAKESPYVGTQIINNIAAGIITRIITKIYRGR